MFRDESTKVIQKAHAQWGVQDSPDGSEASGSSPTSTSPTSSLGGRTRTSFTESVSSGSPVSPDGSRLTATRVPREVHATLVDRAVQFYLEHYVIGLPDEAKAGKDLRQEPWVFSTVTRDSMAAVGLASQSNLTGDKELMALGRQQYGLALQGTAFGLRDIQGLDVGIYLRAIVMLGMFEIVGGDGLPTMGAQTHIMGGAALMRSILPFFQTSPDGLRGLVQLCFSMVSTVMCSVQQLSPEPNIMIPTSPVPSMAEGVLPPTFLELITLSRSRASAEDMPAAELINIVSRFVQLSAVVRSRLLKDRQPEACGIIRQALEIEVQLDTWEGRQQQGVWAFTEERADHGFFPPGTVFEDSFHTYTNMWTARVWTNYRFARILVNQLLLECVDRFPSSSLHLIKPAQQRRAYDVIKRIARDTLVSISTHYRHPGLDHTHREYFDKTKGGAGIGAAQIPTLLFQIKVAGAAPGVPHKSWEWALAMLRTMWADTGMLQAKRLSELLAKVKEETRTAVFIKWEDE